MFKIIENDDGSTTVYCNDTGRILCSVPRKRDKPLAEIQHNSVVEEKSQKIMSTLLPKKKHSKGIGRPIPREVEPTQPRPILSNGQHPSNGYSPLQCNIRPLPWLDDVAGVVAEKCEFKSQDDIALEQDINEECISQPEFLQILNLCPKELAENGEWRKLREDLSTRMIARPSQKHFVSSSDKLSEYDITTPISLRWLKETPEGQKKNLNDNGIAMSMKKYETFCKFAIGSPYSGISSPYSMRCREQKDNVTFKPMKAQVASHQYCFTRRQRVERKIAVETGLNKRSRQLQEIVLKNKLSIHVKRLSKEDVKKWTTRRPSQTTYSIQLVNCKLDNSSKMSPELKNGLNPGCSIRNRSMPQSSFGQLPQSSVTRSCEVKLQDILQKLESKDQAIYVHGTNIRVRLPATMTKYLPNRNMTFHLDGSSPPQTESHDHPYHRLMPPHKLKNTATLCKTTGDAIKTVTSPNKRPCDTSKMSGGLNKKLKTYSSVSSSPTPSGIQLIDIISDDDDEEGNYIVPMTQSLPLSQAPTKFTFVFKCFGCNLKNKFKSKKMASSSVRDHMVTYHAVTEPKAFLNVHINKASKILLIEAFPGYKEVD